MTFDNCDGKWIALQIRPNHEQISATILKHKNYEVFLPVQRVRRRWSDRIKLIEVPVLPGYVFCKWHTYNGGSQATVVTTPGVVRIVGSNRVPVPIDDREIDSIRRIVESEIRVRSCPYIDAGQSIELIDGPLRGARGILLKRENIQQFVVSLHLLRRSVAVAVDPKWVACTQDAYMHGA